jgi:hypothetical protein
VTTPDEREVLRQEIDAIISKIDNRGDLLFIQWLLKQITSDKPQPDVEELKKLRHAFVRVEKAFRHQTAPLTPEDYSLVAKYVGGELDGMPRSLRNAVRFFRQQAKMSRIALSKKLRTPLRFVLRLERGQVRDISIEGLIELAYALGVSTATFTDKIMEFEKNG